MAMPSSSPPDPTPTTTAATAATTAATTATTTRPLLANNPPTQSTNPRPPAPPPLSQTHLQQHHSTAYPPPSHHLFTAQSLPIIAPRQPSTNQIHSQLPANKPHDHPPSQGILYPVASSGRGFVPKPIRPQPSDQTVTIANPGGFPPRPVVGGYHHSVRPFGFSQSDPSQGHSMQLVKPSSNHLQHTLLGSTGGVIPGVVKGVPVSAHPKVALSPSSGADSNGYKDLRDRSKDDSFATVRGRKVRITDGASLYALCRSWLRNGLPEESQPQYMDDLKSLPRPLPIPVDDAHSPAKKEDDKEEGKEDEKNAEHLSTQELLQRHVRHAKRVRARLREERLQRIARYKTRLALLLPPPGEQQFRNDTAA